MLVTNDILHSFINCQYKAYLKGKLQLGSTSEYQILYTKLKQIQTDNFEKHFSTIREGFSKNISFDNSFKKEANALNVNFVNENIDISLDGIEFSGKNFFTPIFITPFEKVTRLDKLFLALQCTLIQTNFNIHAPFCKIIFGQNLKQTKFKVSTFSKAIKKISADLTKLLLNSNTPLFYKNQHCQICEFQNACLEKLVEKDDLSLLTSLKPKEIIQKNNRGVFSVKQLSYSFRPKKNPYRKRTFMPELKALAIRDNKTFIQEIPNLSEVETEIFLDFEGIPDRNSNYLIGLIIRTGNIDIERSFWANSKEEENYIFIQLIELLKPLKSFTIYHYGSYEIQALKSISKKLSTEYQDCLKILMNNSFNLLNVFTHNIYPPTYSNSLKEIARFLKFEWSDKDASGLQSTIWRYNWELNQDEKLKGKLINYNIEDCRALKIVKDWLGRLKNEDNDKQFTSHLKSDNIFKWGITNYVLKDFEEINSKAYFDYQREHIYLRTNKKLYRAVKKNVNNNRAYNKIDRKVSLFPEKCPFCKSKNLIKIRTSEKLQIDISFMRYGIKKNATLYFGGPSTCGKCKRKVPCTNMKTLPMYGYNLMMWSVNQKIQYKQSSESVINFLKDSLKIEVSVTQMTKFKEYVAEKYSDTYHEIISDMIKSELIHADETIARIKNIDGYVWVFANHNSVYYLFKETRETDFLKEILKDFNGVLVSDFYTGYDSLECRQQKCLVHLIRDLNGDFLNNQLDFELKKIVIEFGSVLRSIIATIDKYGLKTKHLNKHKKNVDKFYSNTISAIFESEYALSYQKRFIKYRDKLFCFLNYDNIPWNNNNAEHSIKPFAKWRKKISKNLTKQNIENHLTLLSILQTCKYRGINFFEFLKSGETSIEKFSIKHK